jgi:hypothetical protein
MPGRTTPPRPVHLTAVFPELATMARTVTRLHPRPGSPTVRESSVGGPLLWPRDEPWPTCTRRHEVQVLWCPFFDHDTGLPPAASGHGIGVPAVHLRWRRADEVEDVLEAPPEPELIESEDYLPEPCVLRPEQAVEYPALERLPRAVGERVPAWQDSADHHYNALAFAPGWKVGGWGSGGWLEEDPRDPPRCACGAPTEPLLTLGIAEWNGNDEGGWRPVKDADAEERPRSSFRPPGDPTGVVLGPEEDMQIYRCTASHEHPPVVDLL